MQIPTRYEAIGLGGSNLHMSLVPDRDFPLVCKLGGHVVICSIDRRVVECSCIHSACAAVGIKQVDNDHEQQDLQKRFELWVIRRAAWISWTTYLRWKE